MVPPFWLFNRIKESDKLDISSVFDSCYDKNDKFTMPAFFKMVLIGVIFFAILIGFAKLLIWLT